MLCVEWSMGAKLFIGAARDGALSEQPDLETDLATCVRLIRAWPMMWCFAWKPRIP